MSTARVARVDPQETLARGYIALAGEHVLWYDTFPWPVTRYVGSNFSSFAFR